MRKALPTIPAPRFSGRLTFHSVLPNDLTLRTVLLAPVSTSSFTGVPLILASIRSRESTERNGRVMTRCWEKAGTGKKTKRIRRKPGMTPPAARGWGQRVKDP